MELAEELVTLLRETSGEYVQTYSETYLQPGEYEFWCPECRQMEDHADGCWIGKAENWINDHFDVINEMIPVQEERGWRMKLLGVFR